MKTQKEQTIYYPNYRLKIGFFQTWVIMLKNILKSKELIIELFKRDFFATYRKSLIGISWILISPIVGIISWVLMNATGILNPGDVGVPYPAYVLLGSSLWGLFMGFYTSASDTLNAGIGFINQVKYPHEALLVKQTAQHLANFLITFVINIIVLLLFSIIPDWKIIFFPLLVLPMLFLAAGMGLIISVINVVFPDIPKIVNVVLGFVFYITPIVYSTETNSSFLNKAVELNPLTYLIGGVRDLIIYGQLIYPERFIFVAFISFIFFMFAWRIFFVSEDRVIEKMI